MNQNEKSAMKTSKYSLLIFVITVLFILSCEKDKPAVTDDKPFGKLSSASECKGLKSTSDYTDTPDTLSCIEYVYNDTTRLLRIKHINAGFNCCPGKLYATFQCSSDSILIREYETAPGCHCNCLYDLEFEIKEISKKKYQVNITEPYIGDQDKIEVEIDLSDSPAGSICVERHVYPWGMQQ